jgi:hypothetical protein
MESSTSMVSGNAAMAQYYKRYGSFFSNGDILGMTWDRNTFWPVKEEYFGYGVQSAAPIFQPTPEKPMPTPFLSNEVIPFPPPPPGGRPRPRWMPLPGGDDVIDLNSRRPPPPLPFIPPEILPLIIPFPDAIQCGMIGQCEDVES